MDVDVPTYFASNSFFKRIKIKTTRDLTSQSIGYYIQYIIKVFISKELVKKGIKIELGVSYQQFGGCYSVQDFLKC